MRHPEGQLRARVAALRRRRQARRRRWWPWLAAALLLCALLCLGDCRVEAPAPEALSVGDPVEAGVAAPVPRPDPRLEQVARPRYVPPAPEAPPWLAAFRLQVAARGPRLAACFEGAPRPGSLRWTTALEPGSGRVSDHVLAPTTQSDPLTAAQRACVIGVLETPPYRLEGTHTATTPPRVSIGIAF